VLRAEPNAFDLVVRFVRDVEVDDGKTIYGAPRPACVLRRRYIALHGNLSLAELRSLPTISSAQADDLKIDHDGVRVWLSRMTVEDGAVCDHQVTVETFRASTGQWARWKTYPAR
jgi:hypothetical protein